MSTGLAGLPARYKDGAAFAALFDHTLLKPEARPSDIRMLCREALTHGFKGVCVNPCYVALAAKELSGQKHVLPLAVVGFPLGAVRTDIKIDETLRAIGDGAKEIDMVINAGLYLGGETTAARHDVAAVLRAAGAVPVKVILETALLNPEQITELSRWCAEAGAAFVKTSTGFGARGASVDDIKAMRAGIAAATPNGSQATGQTEIKASGGIRTLDAAVAMVAAGATRVGSSATVKILSDFQAALG